MGIKGSIPIDSDIDIDIIDLIWEYFGIKLKNIDPNTDGTILFGDSIIAFSSIEEYLNVINFGIPRENLGNAVKNIIKLKNIDSKRLIFAYGINDICFGNKNDIIENYEKLVLHFQNCSKIFITSILPVNTDILLSLRNLNVNNNEIFEINKSIESLCNESDNAFYIDTAKNMYDDALNLNEEYTEDGVHLNENGYEVFYANISDCFKL